MKRMWVVVGALAVASVFATAVRAEPISPISPFGGGKTALPPSCDVQWSTYEGLVGDAVSSLADGNVGAAKINLAAANSVLADARADGCSWAFTVKPPSVITTTPVGPTKP